MNFGTMKARVRSILNRGDVTDAQLGDWINEGLLRSDLTLRNIPSERSLSFTPVTSTGAFDVPADYQEMIEVELDGGLSLTATTAAQLRAAQANEGVSGTPATWARRLDKFLVQPQVGAGETITFLYHGSGTAFTGDDQTSTLATQTPYLFIYGALVLGAEWAQDARQADWQEQFDRLQVELRQRATEEAFSGGTNRVQSAYPIDDQ